jgi:dipeptidase E
MRTLLLTSTGMRGSKYEILSILPKPAENIRLAYIITASKPVEDKSYVDKDRELMKEAGFNVKDFDIEHKNEKQIIEFLEDMDIMYVQGGNAFYLLKCMRQSGFDKAVKKLIKKGVIYIGVDAGSIVAGKTIKTAKWVDPDKNTVNLINLAGLGLVPFNIFVHYTPACDEMIKKEQPKSRHWIRILSDGQALLVQNKTITLLGHGEEVVY